jgi:diguanylate cyclase (GGDEF)-like protein
MCSIGNAVFTFQLERYGEEKLWWANHTYEVLNVTEKLLSYLKDAETGQRGYLLTVNTSYLEPYHNGVGSATKSYERLLELTSDDAEQQERLISVKEAMTHKFKELASTIELAQRGRVNEAIGIVKGNEGKSYMDNIRSDFGSFINAELVHLERRKGDYRENRAQITTLIAVEITIFIGLAIITLTLLKRNFFNPLKLLLFNAKKVEAGEKIDVEDILEKDEMGTLLSTFYMMSKKISQRERILDYKAHHDELTGLKNRVVISREIDQSICDLQKNGGKIAVLFLDLNLFKQINDTLGHEVGDMVLKETADRLTSSVRSIDTVFRVGGDEFLVILRNIKNIEDVHGIARNILNAFEKPAIVQGKQLDVSTSIGIAVSPDDTASSEEIVKFADIAMYAAKRDKASSYKLFEKSMLRRSSDVS